MAMADEDDDDDEAAAADGERNELDVRAAIARAPNDDRDAEGARRPADPFRSPGAVRADKSGQSQDGRLMPGLRRFRVAGAASPTPREREMPR